jgi:hypothetical protein
MHGAINAKKDFVEADAKKMELASLQTIVELWCTM